MIIIMMMIIIIIINNNINNKYYLFTVSISWIIFFFLNLVFFAWILFLSLRIFSNSDWVYCDFSLRNNDESTISSWWSVNNAVTCSRIFSNVNSAVSPIVTPDGSFKWRCNVKLSLFDSSPDKDIRILAIELSTFDSWSCFFLKIMKI